MKIYGYGISRSLASDVFHSDFSERSLGSRRPEDEQCRFHIEIQNFLTTSPMFYDRSLLDGMRSKKPLRGRHQ